LCLCLTGCTGFLLGDHKSTPAPAPESGSAASARDNAISGEIRRKIAGDEALNGYTIGVTTTDGRVRLSGSVGSYPARDRAVQIAQGTGGVRAVDNRIVVNTNL
jgi:osmotically-inducible protein OsmY